MSRRSEPRYDEIGYWSEIKLDIVKEYAAAYSKILCAQTRPPLEHVYIDAFAGAGVHVSKTTGDFVSGSPINALLVQPPFREYHLIDLDSTKVEALRRRIGPRADVFVHEGDCNKILLEQILPRVRYEDYRRALCLLDPYGLHLSWQVIRTAGHLKSVDLFLNFPVADMNRNVLWHDPKNVDPADIERMNAFWGDDTWRRIAYTTERDLFGHEEKTDNETVAQGFRQRLRQVAGFDHVLDPLPMRNSKGAVVYYLFFASQKLVAGSIVKDIFAKYRMRLAR
jgi:three-Cys-motif partner protein